MEDDDNKHFFFSGEPLTFTSLFETHDIRLRFQRNETNSFCVIGGHYSGTVSMRAEKTKRGRKFFFLAKSKTGYIGKPLNPDVLRKQLKD